MSIEIIKVIKEAEEKAESIKKEAAQQAKQIITNANAQALQIVEEAGELAESKRTDVLKAAESQGQLLYDSIISDAAKKCDDILKCADQNMDKAASIILERIVKAGGNS
ncbi:MAG: hypothetical protein AAGU76_16275 [Sedimentibacter sp.]|uniref:hypothetical protein n=1 Tax=Sedimentibacter sp. TaxID=1960295 RepID=UPI003158831E